MAAIMDTHHNASIRELWAGKPTSMLDTLDQVKQFIKSNESEITLLVGVILISLISFAAGRLATPTPQKQVIFVSDQQAFIAEHSAFQHSTSTETLQEKSQQKQDTFVASKNSTKYHLPNCPGAQRIAEHNKIWFSSKEEAEFLGYEPASNCPGL